MNMNQLASLVAMREGKHTELPIAQIKEVLRCLRDEINDDLASAVCWNDYRFHKTLLKKLAPKKKVKRKVSK